MNIQEPDNALLFYSAKPARQFSFVIALFLMSLIVGEFVGAVCLLIAEHFSLAALTTIDYSNPDTIKGLYAGQILGAIVTFLLPVFIFTLNYTKNKIDYLKLNKSASVLIFILSGGLMICAVPLINRMAELNSEIPMPDFINKLQNSADTAISAFTDHQSPARLIINIFMVGFLAAILEELFFRGVLQRILIEWTKNVHFGIWIAAFLFSFFHFEFSGFIPRFFMGVYLGYLFLWTGSLWVPIFVHFINNSIALVFLFIEDHNIIPKDTDKLGEKSSDLLAYTISAIIVAMLLAIIYNTAKREKYLKFQN
jgi:membrane protease YdiL (CAAX protease family)